MRKPQAKGGIVVIGELNVDAIATGLSSFPRLGSEVLVSDYHLTLGSASAIFACGAARLGNPVTFVSRVGTDGFADFCLRALTDAGIDTDRVARVPSERTGVTLSLSTRRDRALVTFLGAIASLSAEHLDLSVFVGQRHLHMTSYFLQTGLRPSFPTIMREAREAGLETSFDPNSDPNHSWGRGIRKVFAQTDILLLNDREAVGLTGARDVPAALRALGGDVRCVVVKRGPRGAMAIHDGKIHRSSGFEVDAVDTTGAGDSFASGFVTAWLRRLGVDECLRMGNACGALSTLEPGGTAGQPDLRTIRRFLRERGAGA